MNGLPPSTPASDGSRGEAQTFAVRSTQAPTGKPKLKPHPIRPHRPDEERQMLRRVTAAFAVQERRADDGTDAAWDSEDSRPAKPSASRLYRD